MKYSKIPKQIRFDEYQLVASLDLIGEVHIRTHHEHLFLSIVNTDSYRT